VSQRRAVITKQFAVDQPYDLVFQISRNLHVPDGALFHRSYEVEDITVCVALCEEALKDILADVNSEMSCLKMSFESGASLAFYLHRRMCDLEISYCLLHRRQDFLMQGMI